jgi:lysine N-acyltransferase
VSSGDLRSRLGVRPEGSGGRALAGPVSAAVAAAGPPPPLTLAPPWSAVPVRPGTSAVGLVARWMAEPHVSAFWQQDWEPDRWAAEISRQHAGHHSRPWLVALDGIPVAYVEVYRVARDVVALHHPVGPHDLGVHIAIGDPARTRRGLGPRVLRAVADGLLAADPACCHVIGDPDVTHIAARRAFAAAGFRPLADVDLPHKRAALVAYDRPIPGEAAR